LQQANAEGKEKPKDSQDPVKAAGNSRVQTAALCPNLTGWMSQVATVNRVLKNFSEKIKFCCSWKQVYIK